MTSSSDTSRDSENKEEKILSLPQDFLDKVQAFSTPEEKIGSGLQFMRTSISQEGSPRFREFWEARRFVLPFFKENLNLAIRSTLWNEYVELTVEARRLKEILEEQSLFAMEQIDLAVQAIETETAAFDPKEAYVEIPFPQLSEITEQRIALYEKLQAELNFLNAQAGRLNGLRKEVIRTDMRIRFKTKFFKRLSDLGDRIFPRRKALIEEVSSEFEKDIQRFAEIHFKDGQVVGAPYYVLRDQIKSLQGVAKFLTLSSAVFTRTRLMLSEFWDQIRALEKEYKKEAVEKKQASLEQRQAIQALVDALKEKTAQLSFKEVDLEIAEISKQMRAVFLHHEDVRALQNELSQIRAPFIAAQEQKAREMEEAEKERLRLKREKVTSIKDALTRLIKDAEALDLEVLNSGYQDIQAQLELAELSKMEKQQLDRSLRPVKDLIAEKKERSLLNLSEDDKKALDTLKLVLQQKKERRHEVKQQIEVYRKMLGSSSLDFEKAMNCRELMDQEKERLKKADDGIYEIERKIAELES